MAKGLRTPLGHYQTFIYRRILTKVYILGDFRALFGS